MIVKWLCLYKLQLAQIELKRLTAGFHVAVNVPIFFVSICRVLGKGFYVTRSASEERDISQKTSAIIHWQWHEMMMKVISVERYTIFNEGSLVLPSAKAKPEAFEVIKPSRS